MNSGSRRGETGQQPAPSIGRCALDLPRPPLSLVLEPELDVFMVLQTPGPRQGGGHAAGLAGDTPLAAHASVGFRVLVSLC